MGDPVEAGRWYLLSSAAGADVEEAVGRFVESCGGVPAHVAAALPHFRRRWDVTLYAGVALARIEQHGLQSCFEREARLRDATSHPQPWRQKAFAVGCIVVFVALGGALVVGVITILRLLRRVLG